MKKVFKIKNEIANRFGYNNWGDLYVSDDLSNAIIDEVVKKQSIEFAIWLFSKISVNLPDMKETIENLYTTGYESL